MPQLDPSVFASQIFWLAITFTALYVLMSRIVLPRIGGVLEARSERLSADLDRAETLKKEADQVIATYEDALAEARRQAGAVIGETTREIEAMAAERDKAFAAELAGKIEAAEERIARARDEATSHVREIAVEAAQTVTARLIDADVDAAAATKAVDRLLSERG